MPWVKFASVFLLSLQSCSTIGHVCRFHPVNTRCESAATAATGTHDNEIQSVLNLRFLKLCVFFFFTCRCSGGCLMCFGTLWPWFVFVSRLILNAASVSTVVMYMEFLRLACISVFIHVLLSALVRKHGRPPSACDVQLALAVNTNIL